MKWEELTWVDIGDMIKKIATVILPVGSVEQHGPHLPLACDTIGAYMFSLEIAKHFDGKILVLPPIYYGVSEHHMDFPGTITVSPETLIRLVVEIAESLSRHGVKRLIIINGHGGNTDALNIAIRRIHTQLHMNVSLINPWELISDVIEETLESDVYGHACEFETSLAFVEMPELVRVDRIKDPKIRSIGRYFDIWGKNRAHTPWRTKDFTDTGSIGYPSKATKEKGMKLWKSMLERTIEFIRRFIST